MAEGEEQTDDSSLQELQHYASILRAYDGYRAWGMAKAVRLENALRRLSKEHFRLIDAPAKVQAMRAAVEQNAFILQMLVDPHRAAVTAAGTGVQDDSRTQVMVTRKDGTKAFVPAASEAYVPESDLEKVQSTLKQFVREWGAEGAHERQQAHEPLLHALQTALPGGAARGDRVLVPGAGLGRLVWEVARLGFVAQGCEFSYFMLIASNFILNRLRHCGPIVVHPWALQTCNVASTADQTRGCTVPDTPPWELPEEANLSMCAGDFLEVYREQRAIWDAIVTCFFIDTAHDITKYLARIAALLKPGGVWINMGPLLWHFSDMPGELSIELSWEELRKVIVACGFVFEAEQWQRCAYTCNSASMYSMSYNCIFFVARWPGADVGKGARTSAGAGVGAGAGAGAACAGAGAACAADAGCGASAKRAHAAASGKAAK